MRDKENRDRRIRTSTLKIFVIAAVAGVFILTFSFAYAWGKYEDMIETRSDIRIFASLDLEDLEGNRLTVDDLSGTKLIAFNAWETT